MHTFCYLIKIAFGFREAGARKAIRKNDFVFLGVFDFHLLLPV
jgi:hypothetical protein